MPSLECYYKGFGSEFTRWSRFGAYYAMFPTDFAFEVVSKYSKKGDKILDPFSGRGTSVFAGSVLGRQSVGIEINPLGWIYGSVKLHPAAQDEVLARLKEIYDLRENYEIKNCSEFFKMCFCEDVLKFLLAARENLKWQQNHTDRTLAAFISLHLHNNIGRGLSNQMRHTRAFAIQYSLEWWKKRGFTTPPKINALEFLETKIRWRYARGIPKLKNGLIEFGDSCDISAQMQKTQKGQYSLLFTSPPYCGVTDYFKDQWLRLWLLGGADEPKTKQERHKNKFHNKEAYAKMLDIVFKNCAKLLKKDACVYVRTDCRNFTKETTIKVLKSHFAKHEMQIFDSPLKDNAISQTALHGNFSKKIGETDIVLLPKG